MKLGSVRAAPGVERTRRALIDPLNVDRTYADDPRLPGRTAYRALTMAEPDDLLHELRSRLDTLDRLVQRYRSADVLDLSTDEQARVATAIEHIELAIDQLW